MSLEAFGICSRCWNKLGDPACTCGPMFPAEPATPLLDPCKFCGGTNISFGRRTSGHGESTAHVRCDGCGVEMPEQGYDGIVSAIRKWNSVSTVGPKTTEWEHFGICNALRSRPADGKGGCICRPDAAAVAEMAKNIVAKHQVNQADLIDAIGHFAETMRELGKLEERNAHIGKREA